MTINRILVIEHYEAWQSLYKRKLSLFFPAAAVTIVDSINIDVASLPERNYDLCITAYQTTIGDVAFTMNERLREYEDHLRQRVTALRQGNPDMKIALVTAHSGLEDVAQSLRIEYISKNAHDLFKRLAEYCTGK